MPQGDFVEISAFVNSWEMKLRMLVSQKRPIKFDMYPKLAIPSEIKNLLSQTSYQDLILENDRWQHFFVPPSKETGADRSWSASALKKVGEPSFMTTGLFDLNQ